MAHLGSVLAHCALLSVAAVAAAAMGPAAGDVCGGAECVADAEMVQVVAAVQPRGQAECSHDREAALANWKSGKASLWGLHVTHQGSLTIGEMLANNFQEATQNGKVKRRIREENLEPGRYYLRSLISELGLASSPMKEQVPCNSSKFVSFFVVRDPVSRIIEGDGTWTTTADHHVDSCNTDNYGLRKLIGKSFQHGGPFTREDVEFAKRRLDSFDIVLDMATFDRSVGAMCQALGLTDCRLRQNEWKGIATQQEVLERVGPETYKRWVERNAPELEVYEYGKQLASNFIAQHPEARMPELMEMRTKAGVEAESSQKWICYSP